MQRSWETNDKEEESSTSLTLFHHLSLFLLNLCFTFVSEIINFLLAEHLAKRDIFGNNFYKVCQWYNNTNGQILSCMWIQSICRWGSRKCCKETLNKVIFNWCNSSETGSKEFFYFLGNYYLNKGLQSCRVNNAF